MLNNILMGIQLVLAIFLMLVIMPQEGKGNFSSDFSGGGDEATQTYFKPRGKQAFLLKSTKIVSALFFINALALLVANK
ncbi:MAG: preprotein translocase subunit SecG [Terrisporobacter sp.]|uniref:preprotein translocase subunit SecG n=1 Tax=Terrisporobacter sp. TaxID=1965305 RepID=UPI002FCCA564